MMRARRILLFLFLMGLVVGSLGWAMGRVEAKNNAPVLNSYAPEFTLKDIHGKTVALKDVIRSHKVTLINFWATWCPPCRGEIPELNRVYAGYASKSVAILGVNLQEDQHTLQSFAAQNSMKFTILQDLDGKIGGIYQVYYIPETFIIDRSGKIRQVIQGGTTFDTLKNTIAHLLKEG